MGIISWIILGGVAGWIGSLVMGTDKSQGLGLNIAVGIVGALLGGAVFSFLGNYGITGFNFYSLLVATIGSIIFLWLVNVVRS